jgi:hypothetical protein
MTKGPNAVSKAIGISVPVMVLALSETALAAPIAGLNPAERPAGAPVITEFHRDEAWFENALRGISRPYPYSLRFLEYQGPWHTPFIHPGMTGRYDIRRWHSGG